MLGGGLAARPDDGRALRQLRRDHRHLLQAQLSRAAPQAGEYDLPARSRSGARSGLPRLPALPPGRSGAGPAGRGRRDRTDRSGGGVPRLEAIAAHVGYAPHHFHRLFKRETGQTPAAYARTLRADRLKTALDAGGSVTAAIYEAGYGAPSRAYADAATHLGMTPSAWRAGGRGVTIRWRTIDSSLGPMLVAATDKGLCRISFDEGEAALRNRFPQADLRPADAALDRLAAAVVALVDDPTGAPDLPVDVGGTAFQQAVWSALRAIPAGQTRSYGQIAAAIGRPGAVRAAGTACGDNALAVLIPCHRVLRSDGTAGGYAWGVARKQALLAREKRKK